MNKLIALCGFIAVISLWLFDAFVYSKEPTNETENMDKVRKAIYLYNFNEQSKDAYTASIVGKEMDTLLIHVHLDNSVDFLDSLIQNEYPFSGAEETGFKAIKIRNKMGESKFIEMRN